MDSQPPTFQENASDKPKVEEIKNPPFDPQNQCKACKNRAGKYLTKEGVQVGLYLLNDARGGKICNLCNRQGLGIIKQKMNKSERREEKRNRQMILSMNKLKGVSLSK